MLFEGKIPVHAEPSAVWKLLLDINEFADCVPGVSNVVKIDDSTFDGTIAASVGPISGEFAFRAHIIESDPPRAMAAHVDGTDSVTKSSMTAEMAMTLARLGANETELTYHATVDIRGRLALIGDMVLMATAKLIIQEFTKRLRRKVEVVPAPG
ncbi:MAG: hypothetical protein EXR58_00010 [Chloroflexi bacterium]|nr:hypothetical protein [Chloroflexota bacterium]